MENFVLCHVFSVKIEIFSFQYASIFFILAVFRIKLEQNESNDWIFFCQEKVIFTECYSVTIQECKTLVAKSVTPCFKQFESKINENINREQFINISNDIGKCVGDKYYKSLGETINNRKKKLKLKREYILNDVKRVTYIVNGYHDEHHP